MCWVSNSVDIGFANTDLASRSTRHMVAGHHFHRVRNPGKREGQSTTYYSTNLFLVKYYYTGYLTG